MRRSTSPPSTCSAPSPASTSTAGRWRRPTACRLLPSTTCSPARGGSRYLEGVNDHENLGAVFRNAAALGVDGRAPRPDERRSALPALGPRLAGPRAPRTVHPRQRSTASPRSAAGITTVALTPDSGATPIGELAAHPPERIAFLLGAEGPGLSAGHAGRRRPPRPHPDQCRCRLAEYRYRSGHRVPQTGTVNVRPATVDDARAIAIAHVRAWQSAYRGVDARRLPRRARRRPARRGLGPRPDHAT